MGGGYPKNSAEGHPLTVVLSTLFKITLVPFLEKGRGIYENSCTFHKAHIDVCVLALIDRNIIEHVKQCNFERGRERERERCHYMFFPTL